MPKRPRKKKRARSQIVEAHGVRVRVFARGGRYWLDVHHGDERTRVSAKTADEATALANAASLAAEVARQSLLGSKPETLTLGDVFAAYGRHKGASIEGQYRRAVERREADFLRVWGSATLVISLSQTSVDAYVKTRRDEYIAKQRERDARQNNRRRPLKGEPRQLRDGALDPDFRWLSSVFN